MRFRAGRAHFEEGCNEFADVAIGGAGLEGVIFVQRNSSEHDYLHSFARISQVEKLIYSSGHIYSSLKSAKCQETPSNLL